MGSACSSVSPDGTPRVAEQREEPAALGVSLQPFAAADDRAGNFIEQRGELIDGQSRRRSTKNVMRERAADPMVVMSSAM